MKGLHIDSSNKGRSSLTNILKSPHIYLLPIEGALPVSQEFIRFMPTIGNVSVTRQGVGLRISLLISLDFSFLICKWEWGLD